MYNIPILLVFFNREEIAIQTFEKIRKLKPSKLYLSSDGPRMDKKGEADKVFKLRKKICSLIDWDCEVFTRFLDDNIGCSLGVSSAISWLFSNEECGIILEDDCVPQDSFFPFVQEMLLKYKDDQRIGLIAGFNPIADEVFTENSYLFSNYKSTWGWATWRRSWQNFDLQMKWRGTSYEKSIIYNMGYKGRDRKYWNYRLKAIDANYVSAWDWQWFFSLAAQNQLTIYPKYNLISNIGFGEESTHTAYKSRADESIVTGNLSFPLVHPHFIVPDEAFDYAFHRRNNTLMNKFAQLLPFRLRGLLKLIVVKIQNCKICHI